MKHSTRGFTLIELVVVIVILGVLAAFAVPRFLNVESRARIAAIQGLGGSLRSAAALTHGLAVVNGQTGATGSVAVDGATVNFVWGYPAATALGIHAAIQDTTGFSASAGPPYTFTKTGATGTTPANCNVSYAAAASSGASPTITVSATLATDC